MKYYEMHEEVYKSLDQEGCIAWDGQKDIQRLFDHSTNAEMAKRVDELFQKKENCFALDLGTGTGTSALYLAHKGFTTTGFDISETSIKMAQNNAKKLALKNVQFLVEDLTTISIGARFDLVVDSCLLHCLVTDKDRSNFYKLIQRALSEDGYMFMHTMIQSNDMSEMTDKDYLTFKNNILWSTNPKGWTMEMENINGREMFPHRKILKLEELKNEILEAGLIIDQYQINQQATHPDNFYGWLRLK